MTYSQLLTGLQQTGFSPEQLAPRLRVSHMTLRRWMKEKGQARVPEGYLPQIAETVYELMAEGKLNHLSPAVQLMLQEFRSNSFQAALASLGVHFPDIRGKQSTQDQTTFAIAQIGYSAGHRSEVDAAEKKIRNFFTFGTDWKMHLEKLWAVVRSDQILLADKMVAYGALFYLIFPFDLIPDSIPVIGYLDDFGIIAIAAAYYRNRFANAKIESPSGENRNDN